MKRKLSIITNFENCSLNCPYCIWRKSGNYEMYKNCEWTENFINDQFEAKLFKIFEETKNVDSKVYSISGGSDPLISLGKDNSNKFYNILHKLNSKFGMKYQVHTAFIDKLEILPNEMLENVSKVALHIFELTSIDRIEQVGKFLKSKNIELRCTLVINPALKVDFCDYLEYALYKANIQLSYREMWPFYLHKDLAWFKNASLRHLKNQYIEQADYNTYIMPDLSVRDTFVLEEQE